MTLVILQDHTDDYRTEITIGEEDRAHFDSYWSETDKVLVGLQNNEFFAGRNRWCDLDPWHFMVLIERNMAMIVALSPTDRADLSHRVMRSMIGLVCGLIRCIEDRCQCLVDLLRIIRIANGAATYDYAASMNHSILPARNPARGIRIIVDNT